MKICCKNEGKKMYIHGCGEGVEESRFNITGHVGGAQMYGRVQQGLAGDLDKLLL